MQDPPKVLKDSIGLQKKKKKNLTIITGIKSLYKIGR